MRSWRSTPCGTGRSTNSDSRYQTTIPMVNPNPERAEPRGRDPRHMRLTIAEVKQALAETFGITPDAIQIAIHG
jgi:hypothetical protein